MQGGQEETKLNTWMKKEDEPQIRSILFNFILGSAEIGLQMKKKVTGGT